MSSYEAKARDWLMDVRLYTRVLWRFKFLMVFGFLIAVSLAILATAKVSLHPGKPVFAYRQSPVYAGEETLLITETGFPEGRAVLPISGQGVQPTTTTGQYADPSRLAGLADFYARLATSDVVLRSIPEWQETPLHRPVITAAAVTSSIDNQEALPILAIDGEGKTPEAAIKLTEDAATAFKSYMDQRQEAAGIAGDQRIVLSVLNVPAKAMVVRPRSKTIPLLAFMAVLAAFFGLSLILDRVRPKKSKKSIDVEDLTLPREMLAPQRVPSQPSVIGVGRADAGG